MSILEKFDNTKNLLNNFESKLKDKKCIVTGGASFIGSHLVDALIASGAHVKVIDDFSSGKISNLKESINNSKLKVIEHDISTMINLESEFRGFDLVFNLAAIHGGRGFIETHGSSMLKNLIIDQIVFRAAVEQNIKVIVHASSACAYPVNYQSSTDERHLLSEDLANFDFAGGAFPDGVYGWTKLMGEFQLKNLVSNTKTKGRSARIFTAYGPRENESHAAIALLSKSILQMDPYEIWGDGTQTRNFTFVADTVAGLILAAVDYSENYYSYNIGTTLHIEVNEFVEEIFKITNWRPQKVNRDLTKPSGVASRASNNDFIINKFGWQPSISITEGMLETFNWYINYPDRSKSINDLNSRLMAR
jgi:UDP-glucose 4-epimerase